MDAPWLSLREKERERDSFDSQNDRELYTRAIVRTVFVLFLFLRARFVEITIR